MARSHAATFALGAGLWAAALMAAGPATMESTQHAIEDARQRLKQEILATEIEPGQSVGDLLQEKGLEELERQLSETRPVGGARWLDERSCQIRVELPGERVAEIIGKAAAGREEKKVVTERLSRMMFVSVGQSGGQAAKARPAAERKLVPQQAPEWVNRTITAEAWARTGGSPLMSAQAAEANARKMLKQQVGSLVLAYSTTVQHAGELDSSIAEATAKALSVARVRRTDYGSDGSAKVRVEMNLRVLWDELNR